MDLAQFKKKPQTMKTLGLQVEMIKLKNVSCFPPPVTFGRHPIQCPADTKQSVKCMLLFSR